MGIPDISHEHKIFNLVLAGVSLLALLAPLTIKIPGVAEGYSRISWELPACSIRQRTGHACPSCGLTRSVVALYHGQWLASRVYHPAGFLFVSFVFLQLMLRLPIAVSEAPVVAWIDLAQLVLGFLLLGLAFLYRF